MRVVEESRDFPIHDWGNHAALPAPAIMDTTLRDGIQSLLARYPTLEEKQRLMELVMDLGIDAFDIGFPASNPGHRQHTQRLAEYAVGRNPRVRLACLTRSRIEDVQAIVEISQATGVEIEALIFVASSPIRLLVERWDLREMVRWATEAIDFAVKEGLAVNFACEDATRSEPETLRVLHMAALEHGASRFTIPDTVGIANVVSTTRIVRFFREQIIGGHSIGLDWHGHDDRGLAVANALAAVAAGADCIHTTVFGIGERSGNTSLEPVLANLYYLCEARYRIDRLPRLAEYASEVLGEPIPPRKAVIGQNAYATAAGIHGAAILKAWRMGRPELVANAYAGVDPRLTGRETEVWVGPLSGSANVEWKALRLGLPFSQDVVDRVLTRARSLDRILTDKENVEAAQP